MLDYPMHRRTHYNSIGVYGPRLRVTDSPNIWRRNMESFTSQKTHRKCFESTDLVNTAYFDPRATTAPPGRHDSTHDSNSLTPANASSSSPGRQRAFG